MTDLLSTDHLCWSPHWEGDGGWRMVPAGEMGCIIRLHEAYFIMTLDGGVMKDACHDGRMMERRDEGLALLEELTAGC